MWRNAFIAAVVVLVRISAIGAETVQKFDVDGVAREALIFAPTEKATPAPVVFAFHGHGGNMRQASRSFRIQEMWPEAVVVYMQGLNTPGKLTDPDGKKPGWQGQTGLQGDRDLKFFDSVWAWVKANQKVDEKRVYCTGHSNGGGFTYVLWGARGDVFAAYAPSSAAGAAQMKDLKPKPVLHIAGTKDPLVKFEWQKATIDTLKKMNGCEGEGQKASEFITIYRSPAGGPVVETFIHDGGHAPPAASWSAVVEFFKGQASEEKSVGEKLTR